MPKTINKQKNKTKSKAKKNSIINKWNSISNRHRLIAALVIIVSIASLGTYLTRLSKGEDLSAALVAIPKTQYSYPANALFVAPTGSDTASGSISSPLRTIKAAVSKSPSGGTIVMRTGVYREELGTPSKSFTLQPYPNEEAWLDGSEIVTGWAQDGTAWRKDGWTAGNVICAQNPCYDPNLVTSDNPAGGLPDMVFVNGTQLKQVLSLAEVKSGTFFVDRAAQKLYIGNNPNGNTVEATTRNRAMYLQAAAAGTQLKGFGVRRFASQTWFQRNLGQIQASDGAKNILIEKMLFAGGAGSGLFLGGSKSTRSTGNIIRDSVFALNGLSGMNGNYLDGITIENNTFFHNNISRGQMSGAWGSYAGAKIARMTNATVKNNLFQENLAKGFWCDLQCNNNKIVNNMARNNTSHGFFYEVSRSGIIASNISANNGGYGFKISGNTIQVFNNTAYNNSSDNFHIYNDPRTASEEGEYSRNITAINNISASNTGSGNGNHLVNIQMTGVGALNPSDVMTGMDYNLYYRPNSSIPLNILKWQGSSSSKSYTVMNASLRQEVGRETNGVGIDNKPISDLFVNAGGNDFRLTTKTAVNIQGAALPSDVASALGLPDGTRPNIGAISWKTKPTSTTTPAEPTQPPTEQNIPPTLNLTHSQPTTLTAPGAFEVNASAKDADGSVTKIEIYQNNTVVRTCTSVNSCIYKAANYGKGTYTYFAKASDNHTTPATTSSSTVVFNISEAAPAVDSQKPTQPGAISFSLQPNWSKARYVLKMSWAPSTDNVGVSQYIIRRNNTVLGTSSTANFTDNALEAGFPYTYSITAVDASNNVSSATTSTVQGNCFMVWCSIKQL